MTRKSTIANRHRLAANHRRFEAKFQSGVQREELLFLVGFHTIQAELWERSARVFGDDR